MRLARLTLPADEAGVHYHCVSRIVGRQKFLQEAERDQFVILMREYEAFCEVQVLTYCVMDDHFHLLVKVPPRPEVVPTAEQIIAKLKRMTGQHLVEILEEEVAKCRAAGDHQAETALLERHRGRMWNVSTFMKGLKQRFTQWYNPRVNRRGTLWENRFASVLVEGESKALAAMGAYIDLNPVRAGIVRDPKDYPWNGYGAAMAGQRRAKEGLRQIVAGLDRVGESTTAALAFYGNLLCGDAAEPWKALGYAPARSRRGRPPKKPPETAKQEDGTTESAEPTVVAPLEPEVARRVLQNKGKVPMGSYLRSRVRYFSDGMIFGSEDFVEGVFRKRQRWFGSNRKTGARKMRGLAQGELFTARALQLNVFGKAGPESVPPPPQRPEKPRQA
jgi:REP element-mobilizing transposase RayT